MANRAFHLWRKYETAPYRRWACTVQQADTPDGFRVTDLDPSVADVRFLHSMQATLTARHPVRGSFQEGATVLETLDYAGSEHEAHFGTAIRLIPDAVIRGKGRQA